MLLDYQDLSPVKKSVEVEIPSDLISAESRRVADEFGRHAKIPGFRPGKVPPQVVRTRFAKEIQDEVMSRLLPRTFREAIADRGVEPVGDPHLQHIDTFIEGAPVKYKAEFEVKPQIELGEYRGLAIEDAKVEVSDHDIETMIERLREQASSYRPDPERRLTDGDVATIEMTTSADGVEPETRTGQVRIGDEGLLRQISESLFGKGVGDAVSFDHTYPEDASNERLRGKTIKHDITVKEVSVQEKPEVNDEFAKAVGGWENAGQMREVIAADIRKHRELEVRRKKQAQVGELLLARHEFDVPETLVEEELGKSMQNYARFLASQGVDIEKAEIDWQKVRDDFQPEAVKRVKRALILEAIARQEKLQVSDVEVDAEIRRAANEAERDFAEVKHRLKHDGGYEQLRTSLAQEKALELVLSSAVAR
jgi:trigger factor